MTHTRLWWSGVLLAVGGAVYLLFRPGGMLLTIVLRYMGLGVVIDPLRQSVADVRLPEVLVYSLPGGLWSAAYILLMDALWHSHPAWQRRCWTAVIPLLGAGSEALQALGWLPGTPDMADVLCYLLPYILYLMLRS